MIENEKLILCEGCSKVIEPRMFTRFPELCSECESKFKQENRNLFITLKEFIVEEKGRNSRDIERANFSTLYMRRNPYIMNEKLVDAIVIASVEVYEEEEGKGNFNTLLKDIMEMTDKPIMVENVCEKLLAEALERKGFIKDQPLVNCYWLWRNL